MQKTSLKASILIWATFLSLIITVTFISISTKINKNLKNNSSLTESLKLNNDIQNIINSGSIDGNFKSQYLENGEKIIFDSKILLEESLNKGENKVYKIEIQSDLIINILNGGPLNTPSGIITNNATYSNILGDFEITNLGGYTRYQISATGGILSKYTNYKILKQIGNKEIIKSKGTIKNF